MLKVTIILFIIAIVLWFVVKIAVNSMSDTNKAIYAYSNRLPLSISLLALLMFLEWIATVVCLIITIIQW